MCALQEGVLLRQPNNQSIGHDKLENNEAVDVVKVMRILGRLHH
jgi:hypothetical protein